MPHQCTGCGRTFADGSKEMLSGCPDCGGNKFQFDPNSSSDSPARDDAHQGPNDPPNEPGPKNGTPSAPGRENDTPSEPRSSSDRSRTSSSKSPGTGAANAGSSEREPTEADTATSDSTEGTTGVDEDNAQANARSDVVEPSELPDVDDRSNATRGSGTAPAPAGRRTGENGTPANGNDSSSSPDLADLRDELNDQFESIKIVNPGQYELNLMELFDRREQIISLQEDGRYVIEMPESLHEDE